MTTPTLTVLLTDEQLERIADMVAARLSIPAAASTPLPTTPRYYSAQEFADLLGINIKTVYTDCESGRIQHIRIGRGEKEIRIPEAALSAYGQKAGAA